MAGRHIHGWARLVVALAVLVGLAPAALAQADLYPSDRDLFVGYCYGVEDNRSQMVAQTCTNSQTGMDRVMDYLRFGGVESGLPQGFDNPLLGFSNPGNAWGMTNPWDPGAGLNQANPWDPGRGGGNAWSMNSLRPGAMESQTPWGQTARGRKGMDEFFENCRVSTLETGLNIKRYHEYLYSRGFMTGRNPEGIVLAWQRGQQDFALCSRESSSSWEQSCAVRCEPRDWACLSGCYSTTSNSVCKKVRRCYNADDVLPF